MLQRIFQPPPESDAMRIFTCYVMLNAIDRGLQDYVLRYLRNVVELSETAPDTIFWYEGVEGAEALFEEEKALRGCVIAALSNLSHSDKETAIQYYRNLIIQGLFNYSVVSHNRKLQELARMSQMDREGVYTQFSCKCGYRNENVYVKMEDVLIRIFTGRWKCPKCNRSFSHAKKRGSIITTVAGIPR